MTLNMVAEQHYDHDPHVTRRAINPRTDQESPRLSTPVLLRSGWLETDRYQDSLVADDTRKWIECDLTHREHHLDERLPETVMVSRGQNGDA